MLLSEPQKAMPDRPAVLASIAFLGAGGLLASARARQPNSSYQLFSGSAALFLFANYP